MRQNYLSAVNRAHEGTNIQSMDICNSRKNTGGGVQYPKVMMIAAFFQPFHNVESNFALIGPIFKI